MSLLPVSSHRTLDFVTVVGFAIAPFVLPLSAIAAWLAWGLAVVHLVMTLGTAFSDTSNAPVSLRLHASVELLVGIALAALPFVAGWSGTDRWFYVIAGVVILLIRFGSRLPGRRRSRIASA